MHNNIQLHEVYIKYTLLKITCYKTVTYVLYMFIILYALICLRVQDMCNYVRFVCMCARVCAYVLCLYRTTPLFMDNMNLLQKRNQSELNLIEPTLNCNKYVMKLQDFSVVVGILFPQKMNFKPPYG